MRAPEQVPIDEVLPIAADLLEEAGRRGADLAVLPEDFVYQKADAQPLDAPIATVLAEKARLHGMNVSGTIVLGIDGRKYNSTVIFDRRGEFVGRYDKTHLTLMEREGFGLSPGSGLPVFDLDIGCIGVMTCADFLFPEVARCLALAGAGLILFPHQQAEPSPDFQQTLLRARCMDNCVYVVCCSFAATPARDYYPNWVIDPAGEVLAEGPSGQGMTLVDLDIDRKVTLHDYIESGPVDLWDIIVRYRRPEIYGQITHSGPRSAE